MYLSSQILLIRAPKKKNDRILSVAFYLVLWANDWQTLLAKRNLCAQQVHSHDRGLGDKRQSFQCPSSKQYLYSPFAEPSSPYKVDVHIYLGSVSKTRAVPSILSFQFFFSEQVVSSVPSQQVPEHICTQCSITPDGQECLWSSACMLVRQGYLMGNSM